MELLPGISAPNFSLPDQTGQIHTLSENLGAWVVVYFYPKDATPGCTLEACSFRDSRNLFVEKNIKVFGISKDSVASHAKFAGKHHLDFPLLSDESKTVITAYSAWGKKKFMGREYEGVKRLTYLISPQGLIHKIFPQVNPISHAQDILKELV